MNPNVSKTKVKHGPEFAKLPLWLLCRMDLSPSAKNQWARMALYSNGKGTCFASLSLIGKEIGIQERQARRNLDELVSKGLASKKFRKGETSKVKVIERADWKREWEETASQRTPVINDRTTPDILDRTTPVINDLLKEDRKRGVKRGMKHATGGASSGRGFTIPGIDGLGEEGKTLVEFFNSSLPDGRNGWLPVTEITAELSNAIRRAVYDGGELSFAMNTIRAVTEAPESITIPKSKTLTRLLLDNAGGPDGWPDEE